MRRTYFRDLDALVIWLFLALCQPHEANEVARSLYQHFRRNSDFLSYRPDPQSTRKRGDNVSKGSSPKGRALLGVDPVHQFARFCGLGVPARRRRRRGLLRRLLGLVAQVGVRDDRAEEDRDPYPVDRVSDALQDGRCCDQRDLPRGRASSDMLPAGGVRRSGAEAGGWSGVGVGTGRGAPSASSWTP